MTRRTLVITALIALATGLFAQHKPEFALRIHPIRDTFAQTDTAVTLEVTTTNLTDHTLDPTKFAMPYTYIVERDGIPAAKIEQSHMAWLPKGLAPHHKATGSVYVNHYVDMSQPGKYTIQLQEGDVKSNVVTVTLIEHW
jgi:hypothetical protein